MIVAKWQVPCVGCPRSIKPGERMERAGDGWVHVACDPAQQAAAEEWQKAAAAAVASGQDDWCHACWGPIGDCECRVRRVAS